jgi:hypothetical protein
MRKLVLFLIVALAAPACPRAQVSTTTTSVSVISPYDPTLPLWTFQQAPGATGPLFQWQNETGVVTCYVSATGALTNGPGNGCPGGGSGGTVTSVGLAMPLFFSVTGSPITGAGAFTASYNTGLTSTEGYLLGVNGSGAAGLYSPVALDVAVVNLSNAWAATQNFAAISATSITDSGLAAGNCLQAGTGGLLTTTSSPCGSGGGGTVTGATFTGGLIAVTGSTTLAFTVAGTSGGIPYFSSASAWASSGVLTHYGVLFGGGAAGSPTSSAQGAANMPLIGQGAANPIFSTIAYPTSLTSGGVLYASSTTAIAGSALLPAGDFVLGGGVGAAPTATFSIVPTANGGTGANSLAAAFIPTVTGSFTTGDCVKVSNGTGPVFADQGTGCGGAGASLPATQIGYGNSGGTAITSDSGFTRNNTTGAVILTPNGANDAVPIMIGPSEASTTSDELDICGWDTTTSEMDCLNNTKHVWIDYLGNLNLIGNGMAWGLPGQSTQSFQRLYGSTAASNLAPGYFELDDESGTYKTFITASTGHAGDVGVGTSVPGGDTGLGISGSPNVALLLDPTKSWAANNCIEIETTSPAVGQPVSCGSGSGSVTVNGGAGLSSPWNFESGVNVIVSNPSGSNVQFDYSGVSVHTTSYTMVAADSGKLQEMNCSSACTLTLYGTAVNRYEVYVESIGATVATVSLNGLNFNQGNTAPVLSTGRIWHTWDDGTQYWGESPLLAGTGIALSQNGAVSNTTVALSTPVSVSNGGSGAGTFTAHGVILGEGTSPLGVTAVGATNTVLHGNTGADPSFSVVTPSDAAGNTSGSGNFALTAGPTFTGTLTAATLAATTINGAVLSGTFTGAPTLSGNVAFTGTPTFSNPLALGSSTATTQSACDNSTKLATTAFTGIACSNIETGTTYTAPSVSETIWNNGTGNLAVTLPTPFSGLQKCLGNYKARTGAISFIPPSGVTIYYKGVAGTAGSSTGLVSSGAAGDLICVEGTDSTTYEAISGGQGSWTNN